MPIIEPTIEVVKDYEGYFKALVTEWVKRKRNEGKEFKHSHIVVTAGPWRQDAVTYESLGYTIYLDFYAAIRRGFGSLTQQDVNDIIEIL